MSFYRKIRGTIETLFQLGLGGPQWKNNAGVIEARNPTDGGFVVVRGATAVLPTDLAQLQQIPTLPANTITERVTSSNTPLTGVVLDTMVLFLNDSTNNPSNVQLKYIMYSAPINGTVLTVVWMTTQAGAVPPAVASSGGILLEDPNNPGTFLAAGTPTYLGQPFQRFSWQYYGPQWTLMPGS